MSKRMLQRGRYPNGSGIKQTTTNSSQYPNSAPGIQPLSVVPQYEQNPPMQAVPNAWVQPAYPNPNIYQPNPTLQPASEVQGYWSGSQMYPASNQTSWNESNYYKTENPNPTGVANYEQSPAVQEAEQWQQQNPYSQFNNENYTHTQMYQSQYEYPVNSNIPNSNVAWNTESLPMNPQQDQQAFYENGGIYTPQSQSAVQPWPNQSYPNTEPVNETTQNPQWPYLNHTGSEYNASQNANYQCINPTAFALTEPPTIGSVGQVDQESIVNDIKFLNIAEESNIRIENPNPESSVNEEGGSNALSAFFNDSDQSDASAEKPSPAIENDPLPSEECTAQTDTDEPSSQQGAVEVDDDSAVDGSVKDLDVEDGTCPDGKSFVKDEDRANFLQEECIISEDEGWRPDSLSPFPCAEEPVNQEVPEPHLQVISNQQSTTVGEGNNEVDVEEPPNQQIPEGLIPPSRSTSSERDRVVIRPREGSPFKAARPNAPKTDVVQREVTPEKLPPEPRHPTQDNAVAQEVKTILETVPDNLERPADYEELRKQSPFYSPHMKHMREELNSSPTSLLCDNPDIPSVTLAPAAPPISSAKSDRSESSNDSRLDNVSSLASSNLSLFRLNESNITNLSYEAAESEDYNKPKNNTDNSDSMKPLEDLKDSKIFAHNVDSKSSGDGNLAADRDFRHYLPLRDSKINGKSPKDYDRKEVHQIDNSSPSSRRNSVNSDRDLRHDHSNRDPKYDDFRERDLRYDDGDKGHTHDQRNRDQRFTDHRVRDPKYDHRDKVDTRYDDLKGRDFRYDDRKDRDPRYDDRKDRNPRYDDRKDRDPRYDDRKGRDPRFDHRERDPRYDSRERDLNYGDGNDKYNSLRERDSRYDDGRTNARYDQKDPGYDNYRRDPRYNRPSSRDPMYDEKPEANRQRFADQKYPTFDERNYYSDKERSRPSSRSSLRGLEDSPSQPRPENYSYASSQGDPREARRNPGEFGRPSSQNSESEFAKVGKQKYGYYREPYPVEGQPRSTDYYQRQPDNRSYDYDSYQRDPYYASYYDAYRYAYSNYNYGYYDEFYRNDPRYQQYKQAQEQYRQYYEKMHYDEYERSSVHSGRSSVNDLSKEGISSHYAEPDIDSNSSELSACNLQQNYRTDGYSDISNTELEVASTPSTRLTPVKFSYAHPIARFSPGGLLISVVPGQISAVSAAPVRIHNIQEIREDEECFQELKLHQGPLVRGLTHKNDVIEFCSQKIKVVRSKEDVIDRDSTVLLWELMVLLLRQNGSVAGSDIAELLLKDHEVLRPQSSRQAVDTPQGEFPPAEVSDCPSQSHTGDASSPDEGIVVLHDKTTLNPPKTVDVDQLTRKFREFLMFGHKKDALEWAMKNGLWGHALFLASKMDLRTYANVMTRFANSLALNDPLQTLYQLMSGRQPLAMTNVADKKWGDWRPHLAMILSNPSAHPEVDSRSITTLGDTLASKGCLCAAHFCYIMAQVEFGTYELKNSKLVLLTSDHMLPFNEFASNEAIQCTEIYEYAQSLANPSFILVHLQFYKFLYAMRLVEYGFLEEALHYTEIIANKLLQHPQLFQLDFICEVFKLSTTLKYHDPHFLRGQGEYEDQDDPEWLKNLANLALNYNNIMAGNEIQHSNEVPLPDTNQDMNAVQYPPHSSETVPKHSMAESNVHQDSTGSYQMNYYQQDGWIQQNNLQNSSYTANSQAENTGYYQSDVSSTRGSFQRDNSIPSHEENETTDVPSSPVTQTPPYDYYSGAPQQAYESKPAYEPVGGYGNVSVGRERRDSAMSSGSRYSSGSTSVANKTSSKETAKPETKKEKVNTQAGKTWLGGIFSKFLPKGPNQMILPDDKNPTIVWDDQNKCWMNKDSNDEDESSAPLAPPTDTELLGSKSSIQMFQPPSSLPPNTGFTKPISPSNSVSPMPASSIPPLNKFQRPKTKGLRQNYVDLLNTSGATTKPSVSPDTLFSSTLEPISSPKMFVPSASNTIGEISEEQDSNHSDYNSPAGTEPQPEVQASPLMYDPSQMEAKRSSVSSQRHTLGRTGRRQYPTS